MDSLRNLAKEWGWIEGLEGIERELISKLGLGNRLALFRVIVIYCMTIHKGYPCPIVLLSVFKGFA